MTNDASPLDAAALARIQRIGGTELVKKVVELYLSLGAERLQAVHAAVAAGDAAALERAAHTLKSSAGNLGAVRLQQMAQSIETAASSGSIEPGAADRLEAQYHASAAALRQALEELS